MKSHSKLFDHILELGSKTLLSSGESAASLSQPLSRKVRRQHPAVSKIRPVPSRSTVLMDGMQAGIGRGGRGAGLDFSIFPQPTSPLGLSNLNFNDMLNEI